MINNDTPEIDASNAKTGQPDKDNASNGAPRIIRARRGGPLSFRNIAVLAILIVGGAVGYEV